MTQIAASFIAGVGASAGGLEALGALFREMPAGSGIGFVVVTHSSTDHQEILASILDRAGDLPAQAAVDGVEVLADHVYVAPSDVVGIEHGRITLRPAEGSGRDRRPIDRFFGALAQDQTDHAIGIILSGAGSDGTLGLKGIKEVGGLTVAQGSNGSGPRHESMPRSAIASGAVDLVLPVEEMPAKLVAYARTFRPLQNVVEDTSAAGEDLAKIRAEICAILLERVRHDFAGYKERTFLRRVQRRMQVLQLLSFRLYVERLRAEPGEVSLLFRDLLIGVTDFFRDQEAFEALGRLVVPKLLENRSAADQVRIWVPGCATGEEVYSVAILLCEQMERLPAPPRVQIFATDIDEAALETARAARYPEILLESMPPERRRRWFIHDGATFQLNKQVRDLCIFSLHSLVRDPPFSRIDLISCRNLLIYLNADTQAQIVPVLHYALRPNGYLFLGSAESVTQHADLFKPVDKKHRIFQCREHAGFRLQLPLYPSGLRAAAGLSGQARDPHLSGAALRRAVEMRILERFAPAHVVVNREGDVVHYSSRTGKYLEQPAGQPMRQLLPLARRGLRLDLRAGLQEAVESRRTVTRQQIAVDLDDGRTQLVDLTIDPLSDQEREPLFLILFSDVGPTLTPDEAAERHRRSNDENATVQQLDRDLRETRERLQATIEEYETALEELKSANEELVSVNEELQSTNEELETSKEEIQSVNEELSTVNQELNSNIEQLNEANNDLRILFESTGIAIIFLDRRLVIRSFTPPVAELFSVIAGDRGRRLADIVSHVDHPSLHADIDQVLKAGETLEARVTRRDGAAHYLMRILPYRRREGVIDGVVLTFFDVTGMVRAEQRQQTLVHELDHRVRNMLTVVMALANQTMARSADPAEFVRAFKGRLEALARAYGLVTREAWGDVRLDEILREELQPYRLDGKDRVSLDGLPVQLRPKAALAMGLVLHELATNAVKYGALAEPKGRITVQWRAERRDGSDMLRLEWCEHDGPPVVAPAERGFGTELIDREVRYELRGALDLDFAADGLRAVMWLPKQDELLGF